MKLLRAESVILCCYSYIICFVFSSADCKVQTPETFNCKSYSHLKTPKWQSLPRRLKDEYTACGAIPVEHMYVIGDNGTHYTFDNNDFENFLRHAKNLIKNFDYRKKSLTKSEAWIFQVLLDLELKGKHVAVVGSTSPFYESVLLALGASKITVFEYNKLTYDHEQIYVEKQRINEKKAFYQKFDFIITLSSLDHDGLGRYGDDICPYNDLYAMSQLKKMLTNNGKLVLTLPIGLDMLVWNVMRIYGPSRLPLMLRGWDIVDTKGWDKKRLDLKFGGETSWRRTYEPVFILKVSDAKEGNPISQLSIKEDL